MQRRPLIVLSSAAAAGLTLFVAAPALAAASAPSRAGVATVLASPEGTVRTAHVVLPGLAERSVAASALPMRVSATYSLDGKAISARSLVARSGLLKVTYTVENLSAHPVTVSYPNAAGKTVTSTEQVAAPYVGVLATNLPATFRGLQAPAGVTSRGANGSTHVQWSLTPFAPLGSTTESVSYTASVHAGELPGATFDAVPAVAGASTAAAANGPVSTALGKLAAGAGQVLAGLGKLSAGEQQLHDGLAAGVPSAQTLVSGVKQLDTGAGALAAGAGKVASGNTTLAKGAKTAATGASKLSSGLNSAATGGTSLAKGGKAVSSGATQVNDGAQTLAGGVPALAAGLQQISAGLASLTDPATGLPAAQAGLNALRAGIDHPVGAAGASDPGGVLQGAEGIAAGLAQLAAPAGVPAAKAGLQQLQGGIDGGAAQLQGGLSSADQELTALYQNLSDTNDPSGQLRKLLVNSGYNPADSSTGNPGAIQILGAKAPRNDDGSLTTDANGNPIFGPGVIGGLEKLQIQGDAGATAIINGLTTAIAGLNQLAPGSTALVSGVQSLVLPGIDALISGTAKAVAGAQALAAGASSAASGGATLQAGSAKLAAGTKTLASGSKQLSTGASQLSGGLAKLKTGAKQLATGNKAIASGAGKLATGAGQLAPGATKIKTGLDQVLAGVITLPSQTQTAVNGTTALINGTAALSSGTGQIKSGLEQLYGQLPTTIAYTGPSEQSGVIDAVAHTPGAFDNAAFHVTLAPQAAHGNADHVLGLLGLLGLGAALGSVGTRQVIVTRRRTQKESA